MQIVSAKQHLQKVGLGTGAFFLFLLCRDAVVDCMISDPGLSYMIIDPGLP